MNQASAIMAILTKEAAGVAKEIAEACLRAHEKLTILQGFRWEEDEEDEEEDDAEQSEFEDAETQSAENLNAERQTDLWDEDAPFEDDTPAVPVVAQTSEDVYVPTMAEPRERVRLTKDEMREIHQKILEVLKVNPSGLDCSQVAGLFERQKVRCSLTIVRRCLNSLAEQKRVWAARRGKRIVYSAGMR